MISNENKKLSKLTLREYCVDEAINHIGHFSSSEKTESFKVVLKEAYADVILDCLGCTSQEKRLAYKYLLSKGVLVVSNINENEKESCKLIKDTNGFNAAEWEPESFLKKHGYTVSKQIGLSSIERQNILANIIKNYNISSEDICKHIEIMIKLRDGIEKYVDAVQKWREDLIYIYSL